MKKQHIKQEILVSTRTNLANRVFSESNDINENATPEEKFEEALWNGLLKEIFSELMPYNPDQSEKIFIWGIYAGKSYLLVDLADAPGAIKSLFSIDPHLFLPGVNLN